MGKKNKLTKNSEKKAVKDQKGSSVAEDSKSEKEGKLKKKI